MTTTPILVTGASGFIGQHLLKMMAARGIAARAATRQATTADNAVRIADINAHTLWQEALHGVEVVIHLAGRAHVLKETESDPLQAFREVNTQGTLHLAEQMIEAGCRRLVFVSSIGVNGDSTPIDSPFTEASPPAPQVPYAQAKWEAEQGLQQYQDQLEIVIIRPPLVYGPGASGNFRRLQGLLRTSLPLPLGAAHNRRSLIAVQNLCDFLLCCAAAPNVAGETYLISDGEDLSTPELLQRMAGAMNRRVILLPIPEGLLRLPLRVMKRERLLTQLFASLIIDSSKARRQLGWQAPLSVTEALATLAEE